VTKASPSLMQLTRTKKQLPSPEVDWDSDFLEDANNPLEKMYDSEDALEKMKRNVALAQDPFNCTEGASKWKLGWSQKKKDFCCKKAKVGCAESNSTKKTNTSTGTNSSGNEAGNDTANSTEKESHGKKNSTTSSGNETGNATDNSTGSANVTNSSNVTNRSTCVTREDPRVSSAFYTTSPFGTPCVFGVDLRDEGSHCIMEGGKYGSLGWCYTSKDGQSWGSCSESCPLFGPSKVLGAKINKLDSELGDRVRAELEKVLNNTRQENNTTDGPTTAAPGASGKKSTDGTDSPKTSKHAKNHAEKHDDQSTHKKHAVTQEA